ADRAITRVDFRQDNLAATHNAAVSHYLGAAHHAPADNAFPPKFDGDFTILVFRIKHCWLVRACQQITERHERRLVHAATSPTSFSISASSFCTSPSCALIRATSLAGSTLSISCFALGFLRSRFQPR